MTYIGKMVGDFYLKENRLPDDLSNSRNMEFAERIMRERGGGFPSDYSVVTGFAERILIDGWGNPIEYHILGENSFRLSAMDTDRNERIERCFRWDKVTREMQYMPSPAGEQSLYVRMDEIAFVVGLFYLKENRLPADLQAAIDSEKLTQVWLSDFVEYHISGEKSFRLSTNYGRKSWCFESYYKWDENTRKMVRDHIPERKIGDIK